MRYRWRCIPFTAIEAGLLFGRTRDTQLIGSINEHSPSGWRSIVGPPKDFRRIRSATLWTIAMRRFLLLLSLLFTSQHSGSCFERDKRYLVFPTPGTSAPTKVQVFWCDFFFFLSFLIIILFIFLLGKSNLIYISLSHRPLHGFNKQRKLSTTRG